MLPVVGAQITFGHPLDGGGDLHDPVQRCRDHDPQRTAPEQVGEQHQPRRILPVEGRYGHGRLL